MQEVGDVEEEEREELGNKKKNGQSRPAGAAGSRKINKAKKKTGK